MAMGNFYLGIFSLDSNILVSCGMELSETVSRLSAVSPSFGSLHPSLSLVLPADCNHYNEVNPHFSPRNTLQFLGDRTYDKTSERSLR